MTIYSKPDLTREWASAAAPTNVVDPDVAIPGKYEDGWTAEVPPFEFFNYLQQQFSGGLAHINQYGFGVWDAATEYPEGGSCIGSDGYRYIALQTNTGNDPVADSTSFPRVNWKLVGGLEDEGGSVVMVVSASGNYTPPPNVVGLKITAVGAGGGGGGVGSTAGGEAAVASGGAGGATAIKSLGTSAAPIDYQSGYTIVIGTGGNGGANGASGTAGGNTTVVGSGVNLQANGGSGGSGDSGGSAANVRDGVNGGTATGGDVNLNGFPSGAGLRAAGGVRTQISTNGWTSLGGQNRHLSNTNGSNGSVGAGGSPCSATQNEGPFTGGDGSDGLVIIQEFY